MKLKTRKTYDYIFIYLFILICYYYLVLEFARRELNPQTKYTKQLPINPLFNRLLSNAPLDYNPN